MWGESDLSPTPYIQTTPYNPTKQHPMAALVSVLPIVLLFVLMLGFKMAGHRSAFVSLLATAAIAVFLAPTMNFAPEGFTQSGVSWAFIEGALKAVFPILIIILMALFSYNVLVESKDRKSTRLNSSHW